MAGDDGPTELIDRSRLESLRELGEPEGDAFIAELIEIFLRDAEMRLGAVREAEAADSVDQLVEAAHSLKGCCTNIGADALAAAAYELELKARSGDLAGAEPLIARLDDLLTRTRPVLLDLSAAS